MRTTTTERPGRKTRANIPETMRAAAIDRFGPPEALTVEPLPMPELEEAEVLIALEAAGVGSWDAEMRAGWWPGGRPRFPLVVGSDGAGRIADTGPGVRRFKIGDPVYSYRFMN